MRFSKGVLAVIAAALVAAFVAGTFLYRSQEAQQATAAASASPDRLIRPYSPTLGPAGAPVTIVEFLDPECEACASMHPIVKRVMGEFDGRVRLVVRYMPFHGNSARAAALLEASRAHGSYWGMLETFFLRQHEWASHGAPRPELLLEYAVLGGLDKEKWKAEAASPEFQQRIRQDAEDGQALGVNRTPTFYVNGQPLARIGYEPLRDAVAAALAK
jgi:protein-disulfide isomerase